MPKKGERMPEETKRKLSEALKGKMVGENHPNFGKHPSDEICKKISAGRKGKCTGSKNSMFGKDKSGSKNPMFGKTHSEDAKAKIRAANIGKPSTFLGRHHSEETRKKMSASRKGKLMGESNPMFGKKGKDHPLFGVKRSEENCKKISETRKLKIASGEIAINKKVGEKNPMFGKTGIDHPFYGKKHSKETCDKLSKLNEGENNPSWNGGTSFGIYCVKYNARRRKAVRDFFNNLCICTGEPSYNRALAVHHVDHDKDQGCNGKPFNLVPMCLEHHAKELHKKEEYKAYINKTLREGFKWGIWNEEEYMEKVIY